MPKIGFFDRLGAIGGGYAQGAEAEARRKLLQQQAEQIAQQQTSQSAAGEAMFGPSSIVPGARPSGLLGGLLSGGQAPPSAAAPNPLAMRGGGAPAPQQQPPMQLQGGQPQEPQVIPGLPAQPSVTPGMPQGAGAAQAIQKMDFPGLVNTLNSNPKFASLPPAAKMQVLQQMLPMMNAVAQQQYKQMMMRLAPQKQADLEGFRKWQETHGDTTAGTAAKNVDSEIKNREDAAAARKERLGMEKQALADREAKTASDASIKTLSQWQNANKDAENERQRAVADLNNAYSTGARDPDSEGTIKFLKENLQAANDRIKALHDARPNVTDDIGDTVHDTGTKGEGGKITSNKAPSSTRDPTAGASGLAPGAVEDGYRFKGGDPSKKENWEKVQ